MTRGSIERRDGRADYYKGDPRYSANEPHYITTDVSNWRQKHATRAEAQAFLDGYMVTAEYKEQHYTIVSVQEFWDRRNGDRPLRWA